MPPKAIRRGQKPINMERLFVHHGTLLIKFVGRPPGG
jgi:hypothetical protein